MRQRSKTWSGFALLVTVLLVLGCSGGNKSVDELKAEGQKAFIDGNYSRARALFLQGLAKAPSDKDLLYYTGLAFKRDFILDSALFYLKRRELLYPNDRETCRELYELSLQLENWEYALSALSCLVATGDQLEDHYADYAELWAKSNNPLNGYFFVKKAIEVNPDQQNLYMQAANLASILDSNQQALHWIDSALIRFGENGILLSTRAMMLARQEKYAEAEKIYRRVYEKDTSVIPAAINLANVLASQSSRRKQKEALRLYSQARAGASEKLRRDFKLDSLITDLQSRLKK